MVTHEILNPGQNVMAVTFMETELIRLARERNCYGIMCTNVSPLTQQLDQYILGYETIRDQQINQFVRANGDRPFANAPDSDSAIVQFKKL